MREDSRTCAHTRTSMRGASYPYSAAQGQAHPAMARKAGVHVALPRSPSRVATVITSRCTGGSPHAMHVRADALWCSQDSTCQGISWNAKTTHGHAISQPLVLLHHTCIHTVAMHRQHSSCPVPMPRLALPQYTIIVTYHALQQVATKE